MEKLLYIICAHSLFLILFFVTKRPNQGKDKIIIALMLFLALPQAERIMILNNFSVPLSGIMTYPLIYGPLLYFYTLAVISDDRKSDIRDAAHFIPFILFTILPFLPGAGITAMNPPLVRHDTVLHGFSMIYHPALRTVIILSLFFYTIRIFKTVRKHEYAIQDHFSFNSLKINLAWLKWLMLCFIISYTSVIISEIMMPVIIKYRLFHPQVFNGAGLAFLTFMFSFFALKQGTVFHPAADKNKIGVKYEKSGLKEEDADIYLAMIEEHMKKNEPYTDNELTIVDLSDSLNIPKHYIAQIINGKLNKNFYNYINEYRVNKVINMLSDSVYDEHSLLRIAYESGFNSKSTFNTFFKKFTGMTPSEFRRKKV